MQWCNYNYKCKNALACQSFKCLARQSNPPLDISIYTITKLQLGGSQASGNWGGIHPKSKSPGSPDSANYLNCPQNYSLRMRKLPTLLCRILSQRAKALNMCQSIVKKCHECLMYGPCVFLMIYAYLLRNLEVEIYALFPQFVLDWKSDSANFFAFIMYWRW